ncbi:hypothetical protein A2U01_0100134, partial [Trifolium medium]|nr:hypothetical protein [Trifolium medium]
PHHCLFGKLGFVAGTAAAAVETVAFVAAVVGSVSFAFQ